MVRSASSNSTSSIIPGGVVPLHGREREAVVAKLLGIAQIHREPADAVLRAPHIAAEYAESASLRLYGFDLDHRIVGIVGVEPHGDGAIIRDLAVAPDIRRGGIGRALIDYLRGDQRFVSLEGETLAAAIDFYRACGFGVSVDGAMPDGQTRYRFTWRRDLT